MRHFKTAPKRYCGNPPCKQARCAALPAKNELCIRTDACAANQSQLRHGKQPDPTAFGKHRGSSRKPASLRRRTAVANLSISPGFPACRRRIRSHTKRARHPASARDGSVRQIGLPQRSPSRPRHALVSDAITGRCLRPISGHCRRRDRPSRRRTGRRSHNQRLHGLGWNPPDGFPLRGLWRPRFL